jgi:asparagine synthase (glutamine-hydrolysing)
MCGIGGILRVHPPGSPVPPHEVAIPEAWLDILDASIKYRGPDGQGRFRDRAVGPDGTVVDVALVHRRLSILDHAGGAQPMVSMQGRERAQRASELAADHSGPAMSDPDGATFQGLALPVLFHGKPDDAVRYRSLAGERHALARRAPMGKDDLVAVVFNGCIYNHRELREELQAAGHTFESDHSDTEVLLHGWREWHVWLGEHVDAMGAWMIWDRPRARLLVWRGETGEKPMFTTSSHTGASASWVFSSTLIGPRRVRDVMDPDRRSDSRREIGRCIARGYGSPWSDVETLAPRLSAWSVPGDGAPTTHHGLSDQAPDHHHHVHASKAMASGGAEARVERALEDAVRDRLDADVPVACLLSGGIDSSLVVWMAARSGREVRSLCVRMPDARYDESRYASEVARVIGLRHETIDVHPAPASDLVRLIGLIGAPFGDSSLLPTYWAFRAASDFAKVVLTGDGGDELFLGYERYQAARVVGVLRRTGILARALHASMERLSTGAHPKTRISKLARLTRATAGAGYDDLIDIFPSSMLAALIPSVHRSIEERPQPRSATAAARYELQSHFPDGLLAKVDVASLAAGVEARAPFLARDVRRLARSLPEEVLMPGGQRKGLLRQLARKYLPPEIVDRPKMGFAIPIGEWFRTDYGGMKTLLMDTLNSADPFPASKLGLELNRAFISKMVDEHMSGTRDHSQRLYMLLVLGIWVKTL